MMATARETKKQGRGTRHMDGVRQNLAVCRAGRKGLGEKVTCE